VIGGSLAARPPSSQIVEGWVVLTFNLVEIFVRELFPHWSIDAEQFLHDLKPTLRFMFRVPQPRGHEQRFR
jgi:hypothetical protein